MRFLLFSESHKKPLRKDEINKHVMKNYKNRKLFDDIFGEAKDRLLQTFGYDIVELAPEGESKSIIVLFIYLIVRTNRKGLEHSLCDDK